MSKLIHARATVTIPKPSNFLAVVGCAETIDVGHLTDSDLNEVANAVRDEFVANAHARRETSRTAGTAATAWLDVESLTVDELCNVGASLQDGPNNFRSSERAMIVRNMLRAIALRWRAEVSK